MPCFLIWLSMCTNYTMPDNNWHIIFREWLANALSPLKLLTKFKGKNVILSVFTYWNTVLFFSNSKQSFEYSFLFAYKAGLPFNAIENYHKGYIIKQMSPVTYILRALLGLLSTLGIYSKVNSPGLRTWSHYVEAYITWALNSLWPPYDRNYLLTVA